MNKKLDLNLKRGAKRFSATFFAFALIFSACKKEETAIGSDLENSSLDVIKSDTFSIITYSDVLDSMESDETSISLLGAYHDPVFGGVNCGIVTQIVPEAFTQNFPDLANLAVDSVVLALRFSSINYYANLGDISVQVYEIGDALVREDKTYYAFQDPTLVSGNLAIADPLILTPDFVKNVVVGDDTLSPQVRINLNTSVGVDLVTDSKAGLMGADFATSTFKGLYIRVAVDDMAPNFGLAPGQGTVLYFSMEDVLSKMTLYYHSTLDGVANEFDFNINSTCARYNKIDFDREGTVVEATLEDKALGQEAFYMQGSAVRAVIELPYITDFFTNADGEYDPKIINRAELILPIQDFQTDVFDPSTSLFIARIVDDKLSTFTEDYGFGGSLSGNTVNYDEDNKEFRFTMTREIHALLTGEIENVGYRVYAPAFFASTVERIIFNGANTTLKNKPRLEITYTEY